MDPRLELVETSALIAELQRRKDTIVLAYFDPQTKAAADCDVDVKGDLAYAGFLVGVLDDYVRDLRAQFVPQRRRFRTEAPE